MKMLFLRKGKPLLVSDNVSLELDWYQGDTQTNYAQTNKPDWNYFDSAGKLKYKFNSLGYRTKEFNNLHMDPYMLVFGCSYTEGVGLFEEEIWCNHLAGYLKLDLRNLAKAGTGPDIINFNTQLFKRSGFVKPKLVIIQWPQINRKSFGFHCEEGIRLEDRNVNKEETALEKYKASSLASRTTLTWFGLNKSATLPIFSQSVDIPADLKCTKFLAT